MNSSFASNAARNAKVFRSSSYALVFLLMVCVIMTVGNLVQTILPGWHAGILAGVMLFIVADRLYTYRQLKSLTPFSSEWALSLGAQWVLIIVFIRLLLSYVNGLEAFLADLAHFGRGDLENLLTPEFVVTLLLALLPWYLVGEFLALLDEIGLDMKWALHEQPPLVQSEVIPAHQRLVNLIFGVGIVLVILTAVARLDWQTMLSDPASIPGVAWNRFSGGEAGTLLYFAFGLALLSLSRLMSLHTHWNRLRIPVSSQNLTRQWALYSLIFLLTLVVIVSLLPAGDSLGFFSLLGTLLGFLFGVLAFITQIIVILAVFLISLPFALFGKVSPLQNMPTPSLLPTLPMTPVTPPAPNATWAFVRSILLWGVLAVVVIFSILRFVQEHDTILAALRKSRITNWLLLAWQWLYRNAEKTREDLARVLADGWQNLVARLEGKRILPGSGWISLRSLDPRRRVFFFYLAMIRRGDEQGLNRGPSQTPSEYAATLEKALPAAEEDVEAITEAFVEARYSRHEVEARQADLVKALWARIRRALQSKSDRGHSASE